MGIKRPMLPLSTKDYPYIQYPLGGTQKPAIKGEFLIHDL